MRDDRSNKERGVFGPMARVFAVASVCSGLYVGVAGAGAVADPGSEPANPASSTVAQPSSSPSVAAPTSSPSPSPSPSASSSPTPGASQSTAPPAKVDVAKPSSAQIKTDSKSLPARVKRTSSKPPAPTPAPIPAQGLGSFIWQPAPAIALPSFLIDSFRIPPFLLPIYQAAQAQYGVPWEVLAAINEVETDYGRDLSVSSAGAIGWMQFLPNEWKEFGVDANGDGFADPYNPVDAIFAAANYLRIAGGNRDLHFGDAELRKAIFAYNHANWYVDRVLQRAELIAALPPDFLGSLTGLTQGRFPVFARAKYAGALGIDDQLNTHSQSSPSDLSQPSTTSSPRQAVEIFAAAGSPVIAVTDGRIIRMGDSRRLGRYITLQDVFGNTYTYGHLGELATTYPAPKPRQISEDEVMRELKLPRANAAGSAQPVMTGSKTANKHTQRDSNPPKARRRSSITGSPQSPTTSASPHTPKAPAPQQERLFAHPARPAAHAAGGDLQLAAESYVPQPGAPLQLNRNDFEPKRLRAGAHVIAGTTLGSIGKTTSKARPHLLFEIRPAGHDAPRIDPKPILDGWRLLEASARKRNEGEDLLSSNGLTPSIGQLMLMTKEELGKRTLADPRVQIYSCGRSDIASGLIDRRILATLLYLANSGLNPTISSLQCGHSYLTASGNVSEHSAGSAVDIAAINGTPILNHQGPGTITETTIRRLLMLQGSIRPHQIISLMKFDGQDNTLALSDHYNHIHVGFRPLFNPDGKLSLQEQIILKPTDWTKLVQQLNKVPNPKVRRGISQYAVRLTPAT